jgi:hypothetical protein
MQSGSFGFMAHQPQEVKCLPKKPLRKQKNVLHCKRCFQCDKVTVFFGNNMYDDITNKKARR